MENVKLFTIIHRRKRYYRNTTIGKIYIEGKQFCYTLEDAVRGYGIKVYKATAIPPSKSGYDVDIIHSPKFNKDMLCLHSPDYEHTIIKNGIKFDYVYAHGGNTDEDTSGCVLIGYENFWIDNRNQIQDEGYKIKWVIINEVNV